MKNVNIGKNIVSLRQKAGLTQEQLAEYAGVSKSAVSKWENNLTYPDILLLPELATLFNVSVDELMGYEPQLTKEAILRRYEELTALAAKGRTPEALEKSREDIKKYYSCFPFLYRMALFYLNHCMLFENRDELLEDAAEFCRRIRKESDEPGLVKEAFHMEATILTAQNKPAEVLALLGEEIKPLMQETETIAGAFYQLGNIPKANEIYQIMIYQYMLLLIGNSMNYIMLNIDRFDIAEETIKRVSSIMEMYQVDQLHLNAACQFYLTAATVYCTHGMKDQALDMLERYLSVCQNGTIKLHGDDYFDRIEPWLSELNQGVELLRSEAIIKQSMLGGVRDTPQFTLLHNEKRYQAVLKALEIMTDH
ncbi:MAG: helix-turn-helix domain-containing protein [Lachnospiraceae bacterium]